MSFILKKSTRPLFWLTMTLLTMATILSASDLGPGRRRGGGHRPPVQSVIEPAAIALLGVGLASLGIYARKKRAKKP